MYKGEFKVISIQPQYLPDYSFIDIRLQAKFYAVAIYFPVFRSKENEFIKIYNGFIQMS